MRSNSTNPMLHRQLLHSAYIALTRCVPTTGSLAIASVALVVSISTTTRAADEGSVLIRAETLHTADGQTMSPGAVLVTNGKIALVQDSINVDDSIRTVDVEHLMPGLVDAYASVRSAGGNTERTREVTPEFDALVGIDWQSRQFLELLDEGITTAHILPGTDNVIAGTSSVVHTVSTGELTEPEILKEQAGLVLAICRDPSAGNRSRNRPDSIYVRQPTNRMGVVWIARYELQQATEGEASHRLIAQAISGEIPVFSISRTEVDIPSALQLADDFGFKTTIFDAAESYRLTDALAASETPVVITTVPSAGSDRALRGPEGTELRWYALNKLQAAEIPFAIAGGNLLEKARFAVRFGLEPADALTAITQTPAELLGLSDSIGSIRPGQKADLIGFDDSPLSFAANINLRIVDGQIIDMSERLRSGSNAVSKQSTADSNSANSVGPPNGGDGDSTPAAEPTIDSQ